MNLRNILKAFLCIALSVILFTTCNFIYDDDDDDDVATLTKITLSGISKDTISELQQIKESTVIKSFTDSTSSETETYTLTIYENDKCILKTDGSASGLSYSFEYPGSYIEDESSNQTNKTGTITIKLKKTSNDELITLSGSFVYTVATESNTMTESVAWTYHGTSSLRADYNESGTRIFTKNTEIPSSSSGA